MASVAVAVCNAVLLLEPGAGGAVLVRFLTGAALASVYPTSLKFIATYFRSAGRGLAMGAMVGALTLGSSLPHLVRAIGGTGGGVDWRLTVGATSVLALLAAVVFARLREGPHPFPRNAMVSLAQFGAILRNRPVMLANVGYFGHMWELYAMWGWFLAFARSVADAGGWGGVDPSLLAFVVVGMGAPGCLLAGALADRIGRCNTTALAMVVSGTSAVLIGVCVDAEPWVFVLVASIWGLTVVADSAQFSAAVSELSDQDFVGSSLAFQMSVGFAISTVSVWLVPQVADAFGWRWTFLVLVPGPVVGVWAMRTLRRLPEAARLAGGRR